MSPPASHQAFQHQLDLWWKSGDNRLRSTRVSLSHHRWVQRAAEEGLGNHTLRLRILTLHQQWVREVAQATRRGLDPEDCHINTRWSENGIEDMDQT